MPIYIVKDGEERFWNGLMCFSKQQVGAEYMDGMDTPQTVMTTSC